MQTRDVQFLGWDCVEVSSEHLTLRVTRSVGPRIIYLALPGGENLLCEDTEFAVPPPVGPYRTLGGHRLWHGPEEKRSYLPDDAEPVEVEVTVDGLRAEQTVDAAGIQKTIEVHLDPGAARVTVRHTITNRGLWPIEVYPWGLTQLKPGGVAILPQWGGRLDRYSLQPNRALALWAYTRVSDPRLRLGDRCVLVRCDPAVSDPLKIGCANLRGWLAYHRQGTLFVKHAPYQFAARYADLGSSAEVFVNDRFVELEDMAPLQVLDTCDPGVLVETWRVFPDVEFDGTEDGAEAIADSLGLDRIS